MTRRPAATRTSASASQHPGNTMDSPSRTTWEVPRIDLPRGSLIGTGMVCGILAALAAQSLLARIGFEPAALWRDLMAGKTLEMQSIGGWWGIAGAAFVVGALVTATLSRLPLPWRRLRLLRWLAGAAIVAGLAQLGHEAAG